MGFPTKMFILGCFGVPPFKETPIYHLEIIIAPYKKFRVLGVDTAIYFHHSEFIILCTVAILPYEHHQILSFFIILHGQACKMHLLMGGGQDAKERPDALHVRIWDWF